MDNYTQYLNGISRDLGEISDGIIISSNNMQSTVDYLTINLQTTNIILSILVIVLGLNLLLQWLNYRKK